MYINLKERLEKVKLNKHLAFFFGIAFFAVVLIICFAGILTDYQHLCIFLFSMLSGGAFGIGLKLWLFDEYELESYVNFFKYESVKLLRKDEQ